ncbi:MAG: response regulator, partial [Chloroflexi bacterium]|nr:response regulator [Chloroflexota bacterium]
MSLTILIVEDEKHARENIRDILGAKGFNTIEADTLKSARKQIDLGNADIILLDVMLPDGNGPTLLEETAHINPRPPIILVTGHGDIEMAVKAMKNGAHDFLQKPIQIDELEASILRAGDILNMRRELAHLRQRDRENHQFILGK